MAEIATSPGDNEEVQMRLNRTYLILSSYYKKNLNSNLLLSFKKNRSHKLETVATPEQLQTMLNI